MSEDGATDRPWVDAEGGDPPGTETSEPAGCRTTFFRVAAVLDVLLLLLAWAAINDPNHGSGIYTTAGAYAFVLAALVFMFLGFLWLAVEKPSLGVLVRDLGIVVCLVAAVGLWLHSPLAARSYRSADVVGVVASAKHDPAGVEHVRLTDGRVFDLEVPTQTYGSLDKPGRYSPLLSWQSGYAETGDLLLIGEWPNPWFVVAMGPCEGGESGACAFINATGVVRADGFYLEDGLRLPRASTYSDTAVDYDFAGTLKLNSAGEVVGYVGGY